MTIGATAPSLLRGPVLPLNSNNLKSFMTILHSFVPELFTGLGRKSSEAGVCVGLGISMAFLYMCGVYSVSGKAVMCWREVHECQHVARLETGGLSIKRKPRRRLMSECHFS